MSDACQLLLNRQYTGQSDMTSACVGAILSLASAHDAGGHTSWEAFVKSLNGRDFTPGGRQGAPPEEKARRLPSVACSL